MFSACAYPRTTANRRTTGWRIVFFLSVFIGWLFAYPCSAETNQKDLVVGMKTLPLLVNKIVGSATVAIVFDPANPASRSEANSIKAVFDSGFEAPGD